MFALRRTALYLLKQNVQSQNNLFRFHKKYIPFFWKHFGGYNQKYILLHHLHYRTPLLLCCFCKLPFYHDGAIKLTQKYVCFLPIRVSISLFRLPSLVNTTPRYLNVSTCCSVFSLTCRIHCLERHNTPIFLVLMFVPAWSHAAGNR